MKSFFCSVIAALALCVQGGSLVPAAFGASPPVVESVGVSEVTESNAVLSAAIDPVEGGAYYQFQIATDPSELASEILCLENPEAGSDPQCEGVKAKGALPIGELWGEVQSIELDLNDAGVILPPESTYYFRVLAARAADGEEDEAIEWEEPTVVGETKGFTTSGIGGDPSVPPVLAVPQGSPQSHFGHSLLLGPRKPCTGVLRRRRGKLICLKPRFCRGGVAEEALKASSREGLAAPKGVVLLVDERQVRAGERAYARLANFRDPDATYDRFQGAVAYDRTFAVQRWTKKSGWEEDPGSPDGPWPKSIGRLAPGEAGKCYVFRVPAKQPVGRYRFSVHIQLKPRTKFDVAWRTADFRVK